MSNLPINWIDSDAEDEDSWNIGTFNLDVLEDTEGATLMVDFIANSDDVPDITPRDWGPEMQISWDDLVHALAELGWDENALNSAAPAWLRMNVFDSTRYR